MTAAPSNTRVTAFCLASAAAGAAVYAFSPLTVIFLGFAVWLVRFAVRDLTGVERNWVLGSLVSAIALRLGVLAALYVSTNPFREDFVALYGDGRYSIERSLWIWNGFHGRPIEPLHWMSIFAHYGVIEYDRALAILQWFFAPSPYGLTLTSVASFLAGAVILYRTVRPAFGPAASTAGLLVLLFWPTFVVWSVTVLRESFHLLLASAAVAAAVAIGRTEEWPRRLRLAVIVVLCAWLIGTVRATSQLIVAAVIVGGYCVLAATRGVAILIGLLTIAAAGAGVVATRPAVQARVEAATIEMMHYHVGHIESLGKSYRAADQYFYDAWPRSPHVSVSEGIRFLSRSAVMFLAVPLPQHIVSATELLTLPQHFVWFLLLPLACGGALIGLRRDALLTGMLAGYCVISIAVLAPYSGNIGTLVRHRDMLVPFIVWLGALGAIGAVRALSRELHAAH